VPDSDKIWIVALCFDANENGGAGHYFSNFSKTDIVSSDVTDIALGVLVIVPI